jgi:hypothetical protein
MSKLCQSAVGGQPCGRNAVAGELLCEKHLGMKHKLSAAEIRSELAKIGLTVSDEAIEKFQKTWKGREK